MAPPKGLLTTTVTGPPGNGAPSTVPSMATGPPTGAVPAAGPASCCGPAVVGMVSVGARPGRRLAIVPSTVVPAALGKVFTLPLTALPATGTRMAVPGAPQA